MTDAEPRDRQAAAHRIAILAVASVLGGLIAAVAVIGSEVLEPTLTAAAEAALRDEGIPRVAVRFDGREAFLSSSTASATELVRAEIVVESVDGVRWATIDESPSAAEPTLVAAEGTDGAVLIDGVVGSENEATQLHDAAIDAFGEDTVVTLIVLDGVTAAPWAQNAADLFGALVDVDHVSLTLAVDGATLAGESPDPDVVEQAAEAALDPIPLVSTVQPTGPPPADASAIEDTVILFVADSVTLDATAHAALDKLAALLAQYPTVEVTIIGHIAIPTGTEAQAIAFSVRRAQAVADALVTGGIDAERLHVLGAGSSQPVGDNATEAGAAANRRVTVLIMESS